MFCIEGSSTSVIAMIVRHIGGILPTSKPIEQSVQGHMLPCQSHHITR